MENTELSKDAEKFETLLTQHKMSFIEFNELLQTLMKHGELIQQWDQLSVGNKIAIGRYHGDDIPEDVEKKLLAEEKETKKKFSTTKWN